MAATIQDIDARVRSTARQISDRRVDSTFAAALNLCSARTSFVALPLAECIVEKDEKGEVIALSVRIDAALIAVRGNARQHIGESAEELAVQHFLAKVERMQEEPAEESDGGTPD